MMSKFKTHDYLHYLIYFSISNNAKNLQIVLSEWLYEKKKKN